MWGLKYFQYVSFTGGVYMPEALSRLMICEKSHMKIESRVDNWISG